MTTEELKYIEIPSLDKRYEVAVTQEVLDTTLDDYATEDAVKLKADAIVETASGSIASITDGADGLPVKSLNVNIVPKQSGSGDPSPSNVRPITGWDEVEVEQRGKNFIADNHTSSTTLAGITFTKNADGTITANGTATANVYYYLPNGSSSEALNFPQGEYILSGADGGSATTYYMQIWSSGGWHNTVNNNGRFTVDNTIVRSCAIAIRSGVTVNNIVFKPMVRLASDTDDTYEPYQGTSYPISLPSTVYGGTLDVVSGVLTLTKGFVDLGSLSWANSGSYFASEITLNYNDTSQWTVPNGLCDRYKIVAMYYVTNAGARVDKSISWYPNLIRIVDSSYTDETAFKNSLNGAQMVYTFATPTTIQLTPTEITTLLGNNNIWSDAGSVEVEYRADTTLAFEKLRNAILSLGGNI